MKPNVELVTDGIREIVPDGIVTHDGRKIELDTIVFATGFDVMNPPHFRHVVGRGGRSIREVWDEDGVRAYLGTVIGFPNHFDAGPEHRERHNSRCADRAQIGFAIDACARGRAGATRSTCAGRHGRLRDEIHGGSPDRLEQRGCHRGTGRRRSELHDLARVANA